MAFCKGQPGGPGRPKGSPQVLAHQVRHIARKLVTNKAYQRKLQEDLKSRHVEPSVEAMLWYCAFSPVVDMDSHMKERIVRKEEILKVS